MKFLIGLCILLLATHALCAADRGFEFTQEVNYNLALKEQRFPIAQGTFCSYDDGGAYSYIGQIDTSNASRTYMASAYMIAWTEPNSANPAYINHVYYTFDKKNKRMKFTLNPRDRYVYGTWTDEAYMFRLSMDSRTYPFKQAEADAAYGQVLMDSNGGVIFADLTWDTVTNIMWAVGNLQTVGQAAWHLPGPGSGLRVRPLTSSGSCFSVFLDANSAYFGCTSSLIYMPKSNNPVTGTFSPDSLVTLSLGAGKYRTGVIDPLRERLYLGSTIGLGIEFDTSTKSMKRIFFVTSDSGGLAELRAVHLDTTGKTPVLYWATYDGRAIRVNTRDFSNIFSIAQASMPLKFDTIAANNTIGYTNTLSLGHEWVKSTSLMKTYTLTKTNCPVYENCTSCLSIDQEYCGVCLSSGDCTEQSACSGTWRREGICPKAGSVTPSSTSTAGGAHIEYQGTTFETSPSGVHFCRWTRDGVSIGSDQPPIKVTPTTVTCAAPAISEAGDLELSITFFTRVWSPALVIHFYDCSKVSGCANCGELSDCGWCLRSASCTSTANCANHGSTGEWIQGGTCPSVTQVTPDNVSVEGGETLTLLVTGVDVATPIDLKCDFGSIGTTPATRGNNTFTCNSPMADTQTTVAVSLSDSAGTIIVPATDNSAVFLYSCSNMLKCGECLNDNRPKCAWLGGQDKTCVEKSTLTPASPTPSPFVVSTTCPTILSVEPSSLELVSASGQPVQIIGKDLEASDSGLQCYFMRGSNLPLVTTATLVNSTLATCTTPPALNQSGTWTIGIGSGEADTNLLDILFYDCSSSMDCGSCMNPAQPACRWCNTLGSLACGSVSFRSICVAPLQSLSECPLLNHSNPESMIFTGGAMVAVEGQHKLRNEVGSEPPYLAKIFCSYELTSQAPTYVNATWISDTTINCDPAPSSPVSDPKAKISLVDLNLHQYTNKLPLPYVNCSVYAECEECLSKSSMCNWCGSTCDSQCDIQSPTRGCPRVLQVTPDHASVLGHDIVTIEGENFHVPVSKKRGMAATALYECDFGGQTVPASPVSATSIGCPTPKVAAPGNISLTLRLNGQAYLGPVLIDFFSCPEDATANACNQQCLSASPYCGWCVGTSKCTSGAMTKCTNLWQSPCVGATLNPPHASLKGGSSITVTLDAPIADSVDVGMLLCSFGSAGTTMATFTKGSMEATCTTPPAGQSGATSFSLAYLHPQSPDQVARYYTPSTTFTYVDCASRKNCDACNATPNCGWCSANRKCTLAQDCNNAARNWSNKKCPLNALALGLGLGLGLFFFILLILLIIFLILRRQKQKGLIIELEEPDYMVIAFGTDVQLQWKVPEHNYKILDTALARRDFLLQLAIGFNCPATEQDALAKALVYVACYHGVAAEMIQTCIRAEVMACLEENTLFRNNSVASRMYKFYSRIVGIKYLFDCIARVILELEVLGRKTQEKGKAGPGKDSAEMQERGRDTSLLSVTMELDQTKALEDDMDTETNLLQLQLICQKLMNVLIKTSVKNIPPPFRKIFVEIDNSVMAKFAGSHEAVYKGIGGLFFLRFVCPAITAPHVYGLLKMPPNPTTQRQLVLISKVIQSIANMALPGKKEEYMTALTDYIQSSIPRIIKFYDNLRQAMNMPVSGGESTNELPFEVPETVHQNGLCVTWNFLWTEKDKIKKWAESDGNQSLDQMQKQDLIEILDDCASNYSGAPKKVRTGAEAETPESGGKKKKKKEKAS